MLPPARPETEKTDPLPFVAAWPPTNLPAQPGPLIGREPERRRAAEMLAQPEVRLLTFTGAPGIGKTRLALAVASDLLPLFRHGVFFVDLSPVVDARVALATLAQVLEVRESAGRPILESLKQHLRGRRLLLVLDNLEQLLPLGPDLAGLLASSADLKIIATSREALHLRWEHLFLVHPLAVPDPERLPALEDLARCPAVDLFVERARAVAAGFRLDDRNSAAVAQICARLDGIPLAIELVASQMDVLRPEQILERLRRHGLDQVVGRASDLPERHRTLRQAIDWSHRLLDPAERRLFRRMSVFSGGSTLEAAVEVANLEGLSPPEMDRALASLVRKSLLRREEAEGVEPRLRMLEMVREYGLERLSAVGEEEELRSRHARYHLRLAERNTPELFGTPDAGQLARLGRELDNLRAALQWAISAAEPDLALSLAGKLAFVCGWGGHQAEARRWVDLALERGDRASALPLGRALGMAGFLAWRQADLAAARRHWERALPICRELGWEWLVGLTLASLALVADYQGDYDRARSLAEEALEVCTRIGHRLGMGCSYGVLAIHAEDQGDVAAAQPLFERARALMEECRDPTYLGLVLRGLASLALARGDVAEARRLAEGSLAQHLQLGDRLFSAYPLHLLGEIARREGDHRTALERHREGLLASWDTGDVRGVATGLEALASLALARRQPNRATRLMAAAGAIREAAGCPISPARRPELDRAHAGARSALGPESFAAAWSKAAAMGREEAVALALASRQDAEGHPASTQRMRGGEAALTRREREVAVLIAQHLTSKEIAARLVISVRTAENHVNNILRKLNLATRLELADWAARRRL